MAEKTHVELLGDFYTGSGHMPFRAGETIALPAEEAAELVRTGGAKFASPEPPQELQPHEYHPG